MNIDARRRHPDGTPYTPEEAMAAELHASRAVDMFLQPVQPGQEIDRFGRLVWDDSWMPETVKGRH